jgi:hypothetical protein
MKYKRSWSVLPLIPVLGLGISMAACGSPTSGPTEGPTAPTVTPVNASTETAAPTSSASASVAASVPAAATKSSRGNLVKTLGQAAGTFDPTTKKQLANFVVSAIQPVTCTEPYAIAPTNGHLIALDISITTTPDLASASYPKFGFSPNDFKFIDAATGTTFNGSLGTAATFGCLANGATLPMNGVGPDEKITGKVILDVPGSSGTLVVSQLGDAAWEYNF